MLQITGLFIYPVKSCRGIALAEVQIGPRGFLHDREFMVVDEASEFLTQRTAPELATVRVALKHGSLAVSAPGAGELRLSLANGVETAMAREPRRVRIFDDQVLADDMGDEAAAWFSAALQRSCRLVRAGAGFSRQVSPDKIAPQHRAPRGHDISFTDGFPTLLTSEESLADLNRRLSAPVPMDRFRPNIIVRGGAAYEEDTWNRVRCGDLVFGCASPDLRCVITTTDQQTGRRDGPEPLRTLATYRRAAGGGVMFGQYLVHSGTGALRVGDALLAER